VQWILKGLLLNVTGARQHYGIVYIDGSEKSKNYYVRVLK